MSVVYLYILSMMKKQQDPQLFSPSIGGRPSGNGSTNDSRRGTIELKARNSFVSASSGELINPLIEYSFVRNPLVIHELSKIEGILQRAKNMQAGAYDLFQQELVTSSLSTIFAYLGLISFVH